MEPVEPLRAEGEERAGARLPAARVPARRPSAGTRRASSAASASWRCCGEAWERALAERRCELVTIVGDAGVGKSRLAAEALASIDARVVRGRCLPYGEGITYWPVVEVVKQLDALALRSGRRGGDPLAARRVGGGRRRRRRSPGRSASCSRSRRRSSSSSTTSSGARRRSSTWSSTSRCSPPARRSCSLCMARPELLDSRPSWPVTVRLRAARRRGRRRS